MKYRVTEAMKRKGFTLLELMIVMVFISIIIGSLGWTFVVGLRAWNSGRNRATIRKETAWALDRMVREVAQTDSITSAKVNEIEFEVDLDEDGSDETILFDVSDSNNLNRTEGGAAVVLVKNVGTFELSYRDLDDNLMSIPADVSSQGKRDDIRVITISLTTENLDETITMSSSVYARNIPR